MDSKYSAIGVSTANGFEKFKRKLDNNNKPRKKIKTCDIVNNNLTLNNGEISNNKVLLHSDNKSLETRNDLPVHKVRFRVLEEIKKNSTMILVGETGSGKTTQIPQIIHSSRLEGKGTIAITQPRRVAAITIAMRVASEMDTQVGSIVGTIRSGKTTQIPQIIHSSRLEGKGTIAITQPRRVAAITIAMRVASEMDTQVGSIVGYTVRFEDVTSSATKVKYMTDGMLLREAMVDPLLMNYSVVILDEAHERTVSTDVLFGIIKIAQTERLEKNLNPMKIIIMSATMDVDTFSKYFNNCPVIYLEGRTHPVTIYHSKTNHEDYQYAAICTIFQLHATTPAGHDFLVFLTGQEEIESVLYNIKQIAKEVPGPQIKVCPLYAGLPAAKQLQVWAPAPPGVRKIVLATNIAEASVTIPGIKYIIDTGMVKERSWDMVTGAERLRVCKCAQASSWQRAGRAGRDAPGLAYRLYTQRDFAARNTHSTPEIMRCPLAPTILSLIAIGVEPATFPLIDTPPAESVKASISLLKELGAVDSEINPKLTVIGKKMSAFPIDPKYSKILLSATEYNCLDEALSLVAVLSSESIFHSPMHKREEALKVKQKFISPLGDHITLLNVFKGFCKTPLKKQWCKENYLHHKNLIYASEVRQQLLAICRKFNMKVASCGQAYDQLLKCLVSGLYRNCAWLRGGGEVRGGGGYVTAGGTAASLHPAGVLHSLRPPPPALLFTELLHTRRTYLVTVSAVQPHWLHQKPPPEIVRNSKAR